MHRDRHRKHLVCARMIYDCALNRNHRSIRQPQHHKNLDGVLLFKRRQKILQKRLFGSRCQIVRLYPMCRQPRNRRARARRTCAHDRNSRNRTAPQRQQHKSKDGVHMCGRKRNPAQKKRLRGMISIQRNRKFALQKIFPSMNCRTSVKSQQSRNCVVNGHPNQRQRKRRTFGISSRLAHGRRVPLNHLPCAALNVLSENAQRIRRRMIYRPYRRCRPGKSLRKSKRTDCPYSAAAACFRRTCNHAEAPADHGWQRQPRISYAANSPSTDTGTNSASGAAASHPWKTETKRRTERKIPARRFYSDKRCRADRHAKGAAKNVCIKN